MSGPGVVPGGDGSAAVDSSTAVEAPVAATARASAIDRVAALVALAPTAFALVTEAAWVTVAAGLVQAFLLRNPTATLSGMLVMVVAGLVAGWRLAPRLGLRWPRTALALAVGAGALGWLADPSVRDIFLARGVGGTGAALAANPGGWLAGIAFVRGISNARPPDPRPVATVLAAGIPLFVFAALVGGMVADPFRSRFLTDAQGSVIVFLGAGVVALALARLATVAGDAGTDWRRNPAWISMLAALLAVSVGSALALSLVAGPIVVAVIGASIGPLLLLGLAAGFDRRSVRILAVCIAMSAAIVVILRAIDARPTAVSTATGIPAGPPTDDPTTPIFAMGALALGLVILAVAVLVLARLWMRRPRQARDELDETRTIDRSSTFEQGRPTRRRGFARFRRSPVPTDAVAAYRALIRVLDGRPLLRRDPAETPAEHARRLRSDGLGAFPLDLLAADYGLARFGGVTLTPREDRRGVARAASLERRLRVTADRVATRGPRDGGPGAEDRPGAEQTLEAGPEGQRTGFRPG